MPKFESVFLQIFSCYQTDSIKIKNTILGLRAMTFVGLKFKAFVYGVKNIKKTTKCLNSDFKVSFDFTNFGVFCIAVEVWRETGLKTDKCFFLGVSVSKQIIFANLNANIANYGQKNNCFYNQKLNDKAFKFVMQGTEAK